jgi:hypothetical protein
VKYTPIARITSAETDHEGKLGAGNPGKSELFGTARDVAGRETGGEGGIRTHGTVTRTSVFETDPIDRSGLYLSRLQRIGPSPLPEITIRGPLARCLSRAFRASDPPGSHTTQEPRPGGRGPILECQPTGHEEDWKQNTEGTTFT